jgi:hypothetical protein
MLSATSIANEEITVLSNGNVGIGTTNPTDSFVVAGDMDVQGALTCDSIVESGPFTPLSAATQDGFKSWVQGITDDAKANWWLNSTTPVLTKSADMVANQAPLVEYLFGSLGDTGTNAKTLTLSPAFGTSGQNIAVQNNDGNYLRVDGTGAGVVSASAQITTSTAELISGGDGSGSGLTMSFDIKWDTLGNGDRYYAVGVGPAAMGSIATWDTLGAGTSTVATGFCVGRGVNSASPTSTQVLFVNSTGQYLNYSVLNSADFFFNNVETY